MARRNLTVYATAPYEDVDVIVDRSHTWPVDATEAGLIVGWAGKTAIISAIYLRFAAPELLYDVDVVNALLEVDSWEDSTVESPTGFAHFRVGLLAPDGRWELGAGFDLTNYPLSTDYPHPTSLASDTVDRPEKLVDGEFCGSLDYQIGDLPADLRLTIGSSLDGPDIPLSGEPAVKLRAKLQAYYEGLRDPSPPPLPLSGPVARPAGSSEEDERCGWVLDPYNVDVGMIDRVSLYAADDPSSAGTALLLEIEDHYATWTSGTPAATARYAVEYTYQATGFVTDGGSITWELDTAPAGATITAGGLLQWTPDRSGVFEFTIGARTTANHTVPLSWTVTVAPWGEPVFTAEVTAPVDTRATLDDPVDALAELEAPVVAAASLSEPVVAAAELEAPVVARAALAEPVSAGIALEFPVALAAAVSDSVLCAAGLGDPVEARVEISDPVEAVVVLEVPVEGTAEL